MCTFLWAEAVEALGMKIRIRLSFFVSGFWHGANWTFIAWGFINALYFLPLLLLNKTDQHGSVSLQWDLSSVRVFLNFKHICTDLFMDIFF
jgi:D-alanyl-lipoteichoic acid acyltransferase DltB (MBOAT superfamily)